jgi:hypothetical protein
MTKLIAAAVIIAVLFGGWHLFLYWEKVKNEEETQRKEEVSRQIVPEQLLGMPQSLEASLRAAQGQGASAMRNWLKTYSAAVADPRKAWIELDFVVMVAREDPAEARRVFAGVRDRLPPSSPVWPRVKELEKTYQ